MKKTAFITHPDCLLHTVPEWHVEVPERVSETVRAAAGIDGIVTVDNPRPADPDDLLAAHSFAYVEKVLSEVPEEGFYELADGTFLGFHSDEAVLAAVGCVLHGVENVMNGTYDNAFFAVRPPGHHAGRESAGGFCIFNNAAIGALAAVQKFGAKRVAIVDFDIHHGNGTAEIIAGHPEILYISTHIIDAHYPLTGAEDERGPLGNILNLPFTPDLPPEDFLALYHDRVLPRLTEFAPDIIIVSAGFDGHQDDPVGGYSLSTGDYAKLAEMLCGWRMVAVLEGGYFAEKTADCVKEFLKEMKRKKE